MTQLAYHGTNAPLNTLNKGWKSGIKSGNSLPFQWGGQNAYVAPNAKLAATYGSNIQPVITPNNMRTTLGGSIGKYGLTVGQEGVLSPQQFNKGVTLANELEAGKYKNSAKAIAYRAEIAAAKAAAQSKIPLTTSLMNNAGNFLKSGLRFASGPYIFGANLLAPKSLADGTLGYNSDTAMPPGVSDYLRDVYQSEGQHVNPWNPFTQKNTNLFNSSTLTGSEDLVREVVEANHQAKVAQMGSGLTGLNPMHTSGPTTVIKKAPVPTNIWNTVPATHDAVVNAGGDFGGGGGSDFGGGSSGGGFSNGNIWI